MFQLDENEAQKDVIEQMLTLHNITDEDDRRDLRPLLSSFADGARTEFEATVMTFITFYVVEEIDTWRAFVTEANLNIFVSDSVLVMCSEAAFLTQQPWMIGKAYDLMSNFMCFLAEQFINIFEP
jgi:hypothetical protein